MTRGLGGIVQWQPFPHGWFTFFRKLTGLRFTYDTVNAQCSWVAHCYVEFLRTNEAEHQYGFYHGGCTNPEWVKKSMIRHAWVRVGPMIHDPTRFCFFSNPTPALAVVPVSDPAYDLGMNRVRSAFFGRPMPSYNPRKRVDCTEPIILDIFDGHVDEDRVFWLANLPLDHDVFYDEAHRRAVVRWILEAGHSAWVPIDNRKGITV